VTPVMTDRRLDSGGAIILADPVPRGRAEPAPYTWRAAEAARDAEVAQELTEIRALALRRWLRGNR
jgi:hypothetical protein